MLAPGTSIGRYVVQRKLAEGGMAELYLCTAVGPEGFEKDVVIKRIRSFLASDPGFVQMFIDEARLASRLNHANVVQLFDFDRADDTWFIAMEYVRGVSLAELRRRSAEVGRPIPPLLAAEICAQVARGLHHAHTQTDRGQPLGIVHRDVTPHNVLLGFDGAVKLVDFGIAKASSSATAPGMLKGKFSYMAPEQARGEGVDPRTDVFALGVVLWELLTGSRLFEGDSDIGVLRAVQECVVAPPDRLNPAVPAELSRAVVRALAREPTQRFQSAAELERALAQLVLAHARTLEDTRVDAFLRALGLPEEAPALPLPQAAEGAPAAGSAIAPPPPTGSAPGPGAAGPRTAQQPGLRQSVPRLGAEASAALDTGTEPLLAPTVQRGALDEDAPLPRTAPMRATPWPAPDPAPGPSAPGPDPDGVQAVRRADPGADADDDPGADADDDQDDDASTARTDTERTERAARVDEPRGLRAGGSDTAPLREPLPPRRGAAAPLLALAALAAVGAAAGIALDSRRAGEAPPSPSPSTRGSGQAPPSAPAEVVELDPAGLPKAAGTSGAPRDAPGPNDTEPPPGGEAASSPAAPVAAGGPGAPRAGPGAPAGPASAKDGAGRARRPAPTGFLEISARPFAELLVDGKKRRDVSGTWRGELPAGPHRIELRHPRLTRPPETVVIAPGATARIVFEAPLP